MKLSPNFAKAFLILACSLAASFANAQAQPANPNQQQAQTPAQDYMTITEAQMAEILRANNEAEIEASKLAKSKAANPQVKSYADHMISEHTTNMKKQKEVIQKAKIKPESNPIAQTLQMDSKTKMSDLKKATGAEFDRAYINQQVAMHQKLNDDLTQRMIPAAKDPQYKQFLQTTQTHVEQHLAKAKEIQASMTK